MQRATRKPVLIATHGLDPVGTGRQVELLAHGLAAAGRDVHVACTTTGGALPERLATAGIAVCNGSNPAICSRGRLQRLRFSMSRKWASVSTLMKLTATPLSPARPVRPIRCS